MPNTLTEKALAQPFRVGIMLGALTLPSLWVLSQDALNVLLSRPLLNSEEVTQLFAAGFLPGMVLGAGAVRAWAAWRVQHLGSARWLLIGYSLFAVLPCWLFIPPLLGSHSDILARPPRSWESPLAAYTFLFYDIFPLQVALAMLLFGLFLRGKNA